MPDPLSDAVSVVNTVERCFTDARVPLELATEKGTRWFARRIAHAVMEEVVAARIWQESYVTGAGIRMETTQDRVQELADEIMRGDPDAWWK